MTVMEILTKLKIYEPENHEVENPKLDNPQIQNPRPS